MGIRKGIKQSVSVLTVGIDYRKPMGGVAQVLYVYKDFFSPFKFIRTVVSGNNQVLKAYVFAEAMARFVCRLTFDRDIKIVHVHGSSYASFRRKSMFIRLAKSYGKLVVYHIHGSEYKLYASRHHKQVGDTLRRCDCVIALSDSWKEYFESKFGCKNVVVIKNVIENPQICRNGSDAFSLCFLGRLGNRKGIYDLLNVLIENQEEYRGKLALYFGGDGDVEKCKKIIKDNGIEDIAKYQGWVSGEKKIELLNKADTYILPSYNEGLPISVLEAMSYSLPIISTNVGGIPEILKDGVNGYIIEPGDKQAMKASIDRLMNNKSLRTGMGEKSKEMVKYHLPEYVKEQLEKLYDTLLNEQ